MANIRQKITSVSKISWISIDSVTANDFDVLSGGEANFISGSNGTIRLKPGFKAAEGCKFSAKITSNFAYWKGAGADTNWSTSANWGGDTVPSATDIVYFGSNSDKNCSVDQNVTVAGLIIQQGYDGTIAFNDRTITITGDFIKKDGFLNAGTSKVILAGTGGSGNQKVEFSSSETLYNIEVTNTTGGTVVFNTSFTANEFKINPGNYLKFMAGETFAINTLTGSGTAENHVYLISTNLFYAWNLNLTNSATLSYLAVASCNASGGAYLAAGNSTDLGGNSNTILHSVEITSVLNRYHAKGSPTPATINYTIDGSDGFVADTVKLTIKDKGGGGVYNETEVGDKAIGSYNITWPANADAGGPGINDQVAEDSPFTAKVEIFKECKGVSHDTAEENEKIYIFKVEITDDTVILPMPGGNKLTLGYERWRIIYKISPTTEFTADTAKLEIKDSEDTLVYMVDDIDKTGGTHYHDWHGKWNQSPHSDKYVDPQNSPYTVKVTISKAGSECESNTKDIDVEAKALSGSCVFGYGPNAQDVADKISAAGYDVAVYSNISETQAIENTKEQLVWYCLMHGYKPDKGIWQMRFLANVYPADFQSGLDYKLVFANCCFSLINYWDEYKAKFGADTFVGWNSTDEIPAITAASFGIEFFHRLKDGYTVIESIEYAKEQVPWSVLYNPEYRGNGSLKIVFPLDD